MGEKSDTPRPHGGATAPTGTRISSGSGPVDWPRGMGRAMRGAISTPTGDHSYGVVKRCGCPFAERIRPNFGRLNL